MAKRPSQLNQISQSTLDKANDVVVVEDVSAPDVGYATLADVLGLAVPFLSQLSTRDIGQTSSNVTLDLSKNTVFELEPTANITIDITGLAASGSRARGIINGIDLGSQTLTWTVNGATADVIFSGGSLSLASSTAYDISATSFNQSFDVSGQDDNPESVAWNDDGTKMYMVGGTNDTIYEYTLSTAYNIGTASFNQSFSVSNRDDQATGMAWNNDGTKMYLVGNANAKIYEYTLSTAYDIGTASFNQSLDVSGQDTAPQGMAWNNDGTKMYMIGLNSDKIYEYTLSTAYDIGTASFNQSFDVSGQDTAPAGMAWNGDGTKMYIVGGSNDTIYEYTLSTAYDIGTASFSQSLDISTEDGDPKGMAWNGDGTKMYMAGTFNNNIYEYTGLTLGEQELRLEQFGTGQVLISD